LLRRRWHHLGRLEPEQGSRADEGCRRVGREPPAVAWHRLVLSMQSLIPSFRPRQPLIVVSMQSLIHHSGRGSPGRLHKMLKALHKGRVRVYAVPMNESFAIPWPVGGKRGMSSSISVLVRLYTILLQLLAKPPCAQSCRGPWATWYVAQRAKSAYTRGLPRARQWFSLRTQKRSSSTKSTLTAQKRWTSPTRTTWST
jgi:hypothetical protein